MKNLLFYSPLIVLLILNTSCKVWRISAPDKYHYAPKNAVLLYPVDATTHRPLSSTPALTTPTQSEQDLRASLEALRTQRNTAALNAQTAAPADAATAQVAYDALQRRVTAGEALLKTLYPPTLVPPIAKTLAANVRVEKMGEPFETNTPELGRVQLVKIIPIDTSDKALQKVFPPYITSKDNNLEYAMRMSDVENGTLRKWYPLFSFSPAAGTLFIPGRFRSGVQLTNYPDKRLDGIATTQVQIGPFIGAKARISHIHDYFVTGGVTFTLGSTSLDSLTLDLPLATANATSNQMLRSEYLKTFPLSAPTLSWGGAINFDFAGALVGFAFGFDHLTNNYADRWVYNGKPWYSIGIGFQFFRPGSTSEPTNNN
jgi:hypothetical protein